MPRRACRASWYLCSEARLQEIFYLWRPHLHDPKDDMVLEAAVAGRCEAVVTHNRRKVPDIEPDGADRLLRGALGRMTLRRRVRRHGRNR
jgi:hypothetical protein